MPSTIENTTMKTLFQGDSNRAVLLIVLVIALYSCYWLVQPFLQPIVLAILVGMLAFPAHDRLVDLLRGRHSLAALISCLVLSLVFLIPALLLLVAVLKQGISYSVVVREWATLENVHEIMSHPRVLDVRHRVAELLPDGTLDPDAVRARAVDAAGQMGRRFAGVSTAMLGSMTSFLVNFLLLLFVLFFVLRDHNRMTEFLRHALPLLQRRQPGVDLAAGQLVQVLGNQLRVGDLASIHDQVGQFALGRLARVGDLGVRVADVQRSQQHFHLQTERADIAQAESWGQGYEFHHAGGLIICG